MAIPTGRSCGGLRRLVTAVAAIVLVLVALPYVLTPLYLVGRPVSTLMIARWLSGESVTRDWVALSQISRALPLAVIVAEDAKFCSHPGIDWGALQEVIEDAQEGEVVRGGSTVTQQVAKNLFLWPGRSYVRKALEFPLALWIDLILPKSRILEIYLNVAEWGPDGQFGAEAAARHAFGKPAGGLSRREAATLAAVLPNPARRNAQRPGPGVRRMAGLYEARAAGAGGLDDCLGQAPRPQTARFP